MRFIILFSLVAICCAQDLLESNSLNIEYMRLIKMESPRFESVFELASFEESQKDMSHALNSLILPGWGQYKNGSTTTAFIFLGVEIAAWTLYAVYNAKGNQGRTDVNAYVDNDQSGFNRLRYYHKIYKRTGINVANENDLFQTDGSGNYAADDGTAYNQLRQSAIWQQLRNAEHDYGDGTHMLPESKTQQYYEMVGKYSMFIAGWGYIDDPSYNGPMPTTYYSEFGNGVEYGWPESGRNNRPGFIIDYNDLRDHMNSYFGTSKWMLRTVVMNHVISAIEALIVGKQGNKHLNFEYESRLLYGGQIDRLKINYRF
ncbi:MAG: hypothetical protein KDD94_09185 [Calditrichaeota bacterium]|nr:hypothetical protein [Calditrichota bacterium]